MKIIAFFAMFTSATSSFGIQIPERQNALDVAIQDLTPIVLTPIVTPHILFRFRCDVGVRDVGCWSAALGICLEYFLTLVSSALVRKKRLHWSLALTLGMCSSTTYARGMEDLAPFAAGFLGAIVGLVVGAVLIGFKEQRGGQAMGTLISSSIASALLFGLVMAIGVATKSKRQSAETAAIQSRYATSALGVAVCQSGNGVAQAASTMSAEDVVLLPQILWRCVLGGPQRDSVFREMLPAFQLAHQSDGANAPYCESLRSLHAKQRLDLLKVLLDAGLPLTCTKSHGEPVWFLGLNRSYDSERADAMRTERTLEWLEFLKVSGVNLGERGLYSKKCMLDHVIQSHAAPLILMALDAGCDPSIAPVASSGYEDWSAIIRWTERRFAIKSNCRGAPVLTADEITTISARIPEPRTHDINRAHPNTGETLLHFMLPKENLCQDGGAAVFTYLVSRGADLGLGDRDRGSFLGITLGQMHPGLVAELNKLSDAQFERMAFPVSSDAGQALRPLLETARERGNTDLVELLCTRKIKGCAQ